LVSDAGPAAKEKARLIIPFWGAAYLEKLVNVTIPALLAPGNLPAMVESFDVEVVLVTERALRLKLERSRAYANLQRICATDVRFLDDLLTGVPGDYGVVLSYALYRGFTDLGPRMLDTYLMFLNADFIIADGSYRTLARLMKQGHRVIHAPSFRAVLEDVMPVLRSRIDEDTTSLAVPPRQMVGLALKHKHLTVRARTVNQRLYHQWRMDQFYWFVDEATLIGYQWPIALLAIKPERVLTEPTLMWDYAFVPDAAPTLPRCFIADSDDFFMLEPQGRRSGEEMLRLGSISFDDVAKDLSNWTTKEQRECGRELHVFHTRDLPPDIDKTVAESRAYMDEIYKRLSPRPRPHLHHPLFDAWFSGVQARIRENIASGGSSARPTNAVRLEYAGAGRIVARLPSAANRATVTDGTAILACTFVPQGRRSMLQTRVVTRVFAPHSTTAVLAIFRGDEIAPVALVSRHVPAGEQVQLDLAAELPANSASPIDIQARIGVDDTGELRLDGLEKAEMTVTDLGAAQPILPGPPPPPALRAITERLLRAVYRAIFGRLPDLRMTHPIWQDTQFVARRLRAMAADRGLRSLLVTSHDSHFKERFAERIDVAQLKRTWSSEGREGQYDLCLCELSVDDASDFRAIYATIRPIMKSGGTVIAHVISRDLRGLQVGNTTLFEGMLPDVDVSELRFCGGMPAAIARRVFKWVTSDMELPWFPRYLAIGLTLVALAPFMWFINRRSAARDPCVPVKPWTSMTIELTVRRAAGDAGTTGRAR